MAGEVDVIGGAASGASIGATFGPYGAIIGGVIGAGVGAVNANKRKQARSYARKANNLRESVYRLRSFAEQRNLLRQGQVQAAAVTASADNAGVDPSSSAFQGINGSIYTQMLDNYLIGDQILRRQLKANVYDEKAGKKANQADIIGGLFGLAQGVVSAIPQAPRPKQPGAQPRASVQVGELELIQPAPTRSQSIFDAGP